MRSFRSGDTSGSAAVQAYTRAIGGAQLLQYYRPVPDRQPELAHYVSRVCEAVEILHLVTILVL
jgi:uncharacterized protein (DUF2236 family)